jgi:hypothetical protein
MNIQSGAHSGLRTSLWVRLPLFAAVVSGVFLLAGCGEQTVTKDTKCKTSIPVAQLTSPDSDIYQTNSGAVSLREGVLEAVNEECATRTLVKQGVDRIFGVWNSPEGQLIVYRTTPVDDESMLFYMPVDGTSDPVMITYASAPEYYVTAVSYDRVKDRWIVTAISDLTETIDIIDRKDPSVHTVLDPMPYNDFATLLITVANPSGGFIAIVSPYTAVDRGVEAAWVAYHLDEAGNELGRLQLTEVNEVPETTRKVTPMENGTILIETATCSFNLSAGPESQPTLTRTC